MDKKLLSSDPEINNWVDLWDKAREEWADAEPQAPSAHTGGFFGLFNSDSSNFKKKPSSEETAGWQNLLSEMMGGRKVINEAKKAKKSSPKEAGEYLKKSKAKKKADSKVDDDDPRMDAIDNPNPIVGYSVGIDQEDPKTGNVRVSPFACGVDLEKLMQLMQTMSDLESKFLSADILGDYKESAKNFKTWIEMKQKARELSDKLQPKGKYDLAN